MADLKTAIDIDGSEAVSKALLDLLNKFPGIPDGASIKFASLDTASGIGFFPTSGAVLLSNKEDITGHVKQVCLYPFNVIYRAAPKSESQKLRIMEFLDLLGKWLELQPVVLADDTEYKLDGYPDLQSGNRVIKSVYRTNAGHLNAAYDDGIEDWMLSATLRYENEYNK
ncbi:MAG: hypothetical protein LUD27_00645 [Clostridia bacterium]|nr:hypothetical protein [Clostridia bacterium]